MRNTAWIAAIALLAATACGDSGNPSADPGFDSTPLDLGGDPGTDPGQDPGERDEGPDLFDPGEPDPVRFIRGDANKDDGVDISDPVFLINYVFLGGTKPPGFDAGDETHRCMPRAHFLS